MKQLVTITMALLAGFAGGISGAFVFHSLSSTLPERVVRARSFEMVDEAGKVVSFWGIDDTQQAVLAFGSRGLALGGRRPVNMPLWLKNPDNQLAAFGLLGDDGPILSLRGEDLKTRASAVTQKRPLMVT